MDGFVARVELRRPPHNFVSVELLHNLANAIEALDADPACRAIVMASEGKSFCAGADLASKERGKGSDPDSINPLYTEAVRLFSAAKPIIAEIQGPAVGAGLGLALVADFRVASTEARFVANFAKIGFHPGFGLTYTLPRLIGAQRASLMFLTGRRIKPEEAQAWGLADLVAAPEQLTAEAHRLAAEIAENAPLAVQSTRATLRKGLAEAVKAQTDLEFAQQSWQVQTVDFAEGLRAVSERRAGNFVGR
jgi:enoyl-CoA hydratase/carnithine racemase